MPQNNNGEVATAEPADHEPAQDETGLSGGEAGPKTPEVSNEQTAPAADVSDTALQMPGAATGETIAVPGPSQQQVFPSEEATPTALAPGTATKMRTSDQPDQPPETEDSVGIDKHQDESKHDTLASETTPVEIDLTLADDDDLMIIGSHTKESGLDNSVTEREKAEMEYELEKVRRERRILALRRGEEEAAMREAELRHKIAMNRGRGSGVVSLKAEPGVKVEA